MNYITIGFVMNANILEFQQLHIDRVNKNHLYNLRGGSTEPTTKIYSFKDTANVIFV